MTVTLRPLTDDNWHDAIDLRVTDEQKNFVASNLYSIAETRFEPTFVPLAIYAGEEMVGFTMYDTDDYGIVRFMIDMRHQGKGYGRAALQTLIDQFEREYAHPETRLSFVPGNAVAEHLYERMGFRLNGEMDEDELVMVRPLVAR